MNQPPRDWRQMLAEREDKRDTDEETVELFEQLTQPEPRRWTQTTFEEHLRDT